jgi:hypothetical protein
MKGMNKEMMHSNGWDDSSQVLFGVNWVEVVVVGYRFFEIHRS